MTTRRPPSLDDRDRITDSDFPIGQVVAEIMKGRTDSPVQSTAPPAEILSRIHEPLPLRESPLPEVVREIADVATAYRRKNAHPGMFAYVASPGLPTDPIGHAMVAALNQNATGFRSAPAITMIERTVIGWLIQLAGLPDGADGMFLGGGSWANLSAIAVALHGSESRDTVREGLKDGPQPVILTTKSAHFSVQRAATVLGLGRANVETVPVGSNYRMDPQALRERLAGIAASAERRACAVVATAGSTGLGAVDPLQDIADICREAGVWLHVDAAYGAAALLADDLRPRLKGIERADSITLDLHKWAYLAFDASVLLFRDPRLARSVFAFDADYASTSRSDRMEEHNFYEFSPEVSRRARALPAYLAWRHYGVRRLGRNVSHNAACARYLAELVDDAPDMELIVQPELSIVCFRYRPGELAGEEDRVDRLNEAILAQLNQTEDFVLSPMKLDSRPVIRVCICSYTTEARHVGDLVATVRDLGSNLA